MGKGQLKRGAILSYAAVAFNAVAGLLYTPWMIASIGADDYALYTLSISIVNFFLMDFGLGDAVSRFLSRYYAHGEQDKVSLLLSVVYRLFSILALIIALIFAVIYIFSDVIYANLGTEMLARFRVVFLIVAGYSVLGFPFLPFRGILLANEEFVGLNACTLLQRVFTVGLICICLLFGFGIYALVTVNAIGAFIFTIAKYYLVRKHTSARARMLDWDGPLAREVLGFSAWATLIQICQRMIFSIAPSIIAALSSSWEVALFGLATSLEAYVWSAANALNGMFMPEVARIREHGNAELQALMIRVGRIQVLIIGYIFLALVVFGQRFVTCWVGTEYSNLYFCALLVILPSMLELPQLVGDTALVVGQGIRAKAMVYSVMAVVNLTGLFVLCGPFGAIGACTSICISYLLRTGLLNVVYGMVLKIDIGSFFANVFAKWAVLALTVGIVSYGCNVLLPIGGWAGLALLVLVFTIIYLSVYWKFYFNSDEKALIQSPLKRIWRR